MNAVRQAACVLLLGLGAAGGCALRSQPQSEVQSARTAGATLEARQQQTGAAYRTLQQVRYETRLAEQDYLNAKVAHERATRDLDAATKAYAAAQAREKAAEADYERGLRSVEEMSGAPGSRAR